MGVALFVQLLDRVVEREPFGNSGRQLSVALEFFVNLKIFPLRVVLGGGDAVTGQIRQSQFDGLAAFLVSWFGADGPHRLLRGFAKNAVGRARFIAVDLS